MSACAPLGQLDQLLTALDRQGYRGFLVLEPHLLFRLPEMNGPERFAVALAALRKLLAQAAVSESGRRKAT